MLKNYTIIDLAFMVDQKVIKIFTYLFHFNQIFKLDERKIRI